MNQYRIIVTGTKYVVGSYLVNAKSWTEAEELALQQFENDDMDCCDEIEITEEELVNLD